MPSPSVFHLSVTVIFLIGPSNHITLLWLLPFLFRIKFQIHIYNSFQDLLLSSLSATPTPPLLLTYTFQPHCSSFITFSGLSSYLRATAVFFFVWNTSFLTLNLGSIVLSFILSLNVKYDFLMSPKLDCFSLLYKIYIPFLCLCGSHCTC